MEAISKPAAKNAEVIVGHLDALERILKKYEDALWAQKVAEHKLWLIESLLKNGRPLTTVDFHLIMTTVDKHEEEKNDTNK